MIGIIGAMDVEIDEIKSRMENKAVKTVSGRAFVSGLLNGRDVVVAQCGIGKVNAALCAEAMILTYNPALVINVGVGGSLSAALKYGDIAIADRLVQHDVDTSALGDPVGLVSTLNKVYFECDPHTVECIKAVVDEMDDVHGLIGTIASGDQFISGTAIKERIVGHFGAVCCEMEGGAIAQVCCVNDVKCAVIRSISDNADDDSHSDYGQFTRLAAAHSTQALCRLMEVL